MLIVASQALPWLGLAALLTIGAAATQKRRPGSPTRSKIARNLDRDAARRLDGSAALLALAALCDSGIEHYRGSFHNKTMYVPLAVSAVTLAASLRDTAAPPTVDEPVETVDYLAMATGIIGTGFHLYNVGKRPGGFSWLNLFYAAPLGAPASLSLAGLLRWMAGLLRRRQRAFAGVSNERALASLTALGLLGTSAEAALLHFRGAYQNPAMFIPVTVPPLAAAALARAAMRPGERHPLARGLLRALIAVGLIGPGFHAYGISRGMGGWRNWSQNLLNGPPLPAPPAFTALAIAGLAALDLIEGETR